MFVKWIKIIDPDKVSSFIAKSIMFWFCEEFPPWNKMWDEDFESVVSCLRCLFIKLREAFESHHLPYFFIRSVNVIQYIPDSTNKRVVSNIEQILEDVPGHLPMDIEKELSALEEIIGLLVDTHQAFDDFLHGNFGAFFKRPDLIKELFSKRK